MKRCPLCDFIYEDHQSLCDMDGIELVHDSVALIVPAKVAAHVPESVVRSPLRRLFVLLLVGVVLGVATVAVYHLSTDRAAAGRVLAVPPAATPAPAPAGSPMNEAEEPGPAAPPARPSPTPSRPRAAPLKERKPRPESGNRKKGSKLGSLLGKTGRILKKPFKF